MADDLAEAIAWHERDDRLSRCDCCGERRDDEGDTYRQADGRRFCGNCDAGEHPDCASCVLRRAVLSAGGRSGERHGPTSGGFR